MTLCQSNLIHYQRLYELIATYLPSSHMQLLTFKTRKTPIECMQNQ